MRLEPRQSGSGGSSTNKASINFYLRSSVAPSLIAIEKFGSGGIVLTRDPSNPPLTGSDINNPVGLTLIMDAATGDISADTGITPRITTNILDIQAAAGSIGSANGRIEVDLIQFIARARVDGPSFDGFRSPELLAQARGSTSDIYLSLRGVDRLPSTTATTFTISTGLARVDDSTFTASGDARPDRLRLQCRPRRGRHGRPFEGDGRRRTTRPRT